MTKDENILMMNFALTKENEIIIQVTFYYPSCRHDVNDIIQEYINKKKFEDTKRGNQRCTSKKDNVMDKIKQAF